ncbi:MAG: Hsp20/alpha crystallin family protein [Candidatus Gracilibacteria bacterium]|nr:Hsp20/alpha crystallin family protein [Candidatus Gracilibacteria bacterium]
MFKFFGVSKEEEFDEIFEEEDEVENTKLEKEEIGQIAVDILETKFEIILLAPVAGISLDEIDISFHNNILTISGERFRPEIYAKDITVRNSECYWGEFSRNIILPENLDFDSIKATLDNNLLIITVPKLKFSSQSIRIEKI